MIRECVTWAFASLKARKFLLVSILIIICNRNFMLILVEYDEPQFYNLVISPLGAIWLNDVQCFFNVEIILKTILQI